MIGMLQVTHRPGRDQRPGGGDVTNARMTVAAPGLVSRPAQYAALDRLVGEGSLVVDREEVVDGRLRRYYRITDAGLDVLRRGVEDLEANASAGRGQLARRPDRGLV